MNEVLSYTEAQRAADAVYNRGGSLTLPVGWQLDTTFAANGQLTGASGVYVYALKTVGADDGRRILAFRGTEFPNARDLYADFSDIGGDQFLNAQSAINLWLAEQLVGGNRIELVGHSLGGALAQWAINDTNKAAVTNIVLNPETGLKATAAQFASQLHFTTFNAPGITYVSGLPATDSTTVVSGEHHVLIGSTPFISGDPIHLLGGPPVGGSIIAHRVNFAALGESGFFSHDINKAAYWDLSQSPIVSYTPPYADIGVAQSYAAHFSQLGNSDGTVTSDFEAVARLGLFLVASGVALGANTVALSAQLRGLPFDRDAFANTLVLPVNGINQGLAMILEAAEAAGQNATDLSVRLSTSFVDVLQSVGSFANQVPSFIANTLVPFLTDTAHGIGNAVLDFLQDVPGTLFDLGRTLSFTDISPFTSAYAQALDDRRLAPELRTALEEAQQIVQRAGQTVVVQQGIGANPFNTVGFNPDAVPPVTINLNEEQLKTLTIHLPYDAGIGGQRLQLTLGGPNAGTFVIRMDGVELTGQNGTFTLTIPEGQRQLIVGLRSTDDVSVSSTLTVSATLLDVAGQATHTTHLEAHVAVADTGDLADSDLPQQGPVTQIWTGTPGDDDLSAVGFQDNHSITAGIGNDYLDGWTGDDHLFGEGGADYLLGGQGRDVLEGGEGIDRLEGDGTPSQHASLGLPDNDFLDGGAGDDLLMRNYALQLALTP